MTQNCKRCGKPLSGKTAVQRGYGEICWRFRMTKDEKARIKAENRKARKDAKAAPVQPDQPMTAPGPFQPGSDTATTATGDPNVGH